MSDSFVFDNTAEFLSKAMDVSARRHRLISGNIANMDTLGYKPKDLDFKKTLQRELEKGPQGLTRTHPKHFDVGIDTGLSRRLGTTEGTENYPDPVNIDTEMTHLVENNIKYRTSIEMLLRKMGMLRQAITEGGR